MNHGTGKTHILDEVKPQKYTEEQKNEIYKRAGLINTWANEVSTIDPKEECCYNCDELACTAYDEDHMDAEFWCSKRNIIFNDKAATLEMKCKNYTIIDEDN